MEIDVQSVIPWEEIHPATVRLDSESAVSTGCPIILVQSTAPNDQSNDPNLGYSLDNSYGQAYDVEHVEKA